MTANAMQEDRETCLAAGMDDYVGKPIRTHELAEALSRARRLGDTLGARGDGAGTSLDASAIESLRELDGEGLPRGGDRHVPGATRRPSSQTLRTTYEEGDAEALRRTAHTLKSNGQISGAERFSELCRYLEERARLGKLDGSAKVVDRIEREYAELEKTLAALGSTPAP